MEDDHDDRKVDSRLRPFSSVPGKPVAGRQPLKRRAHVMLYTTATEGELCNVERVGEFRIPDIDILAHGHMGPHRFVYGTYTVHDVEPSGRNVYTGGVALFRLSERMAASMTFIVMCDRFAEHCGLDRDGVDYETFPHPKRPHEKKPTAGLMEEAHPDIQSAIADDIKYVRSERDTTRIWIKPKKGG